MPQLTRSDLYASVWARPLNKVAAELGITGTGLKKLCDRHQIPTPERGYWAKLAYGKRTTQRPLPTLDNSRLEQVNVFGQGGAGLPEPVRRAKSEARERLARAASSQSAIEPSSPVNGVVAEPKILTATRQKMNKARVDSEGFVAGAGEGVVGFKIAPASIDRAIAVLSGLVSLGLSLGYQPKVTEVGLALLVDDEVIPFRIEERPAQSLHEPTAAELKRKVENARWGYGSSTPWPKHDNHPSGRLVVSLQSNEYSGLRRAYGDRQSRRLEDLLPDIAAAFSVHAAYAKEKRRIAAAAAHQRRLAEERREREQAFVKREKYRAAFVDAVAEQLDRRSRLERVLAHLEAAPPDDAQRVQPMANWVRGHIKQIDALISPTFLDLSARTEKIDFDEKRAARTEESGYWYREEKPQLLFWSIDEVAGAAKSQTPLAWAIEAGYAAGIDQIDEATRSPDESPPFS